MRSTRLTGWAWQSRKRHVVQQRGWFHEPFHSPRLLPLGKLLAQVRRSSICSCIMEGFDDDANRQSTELPDQVSALGVIRQCSHQRRSTDASGGTLLEFRLNDGGDDQGVVERVYPEAGKDGFAALPSKSLSLSKSGSRFGLRFPIATSIAIARGGDGATLPARSRRRSRCGWSGGTCPPAGSW